MLKQSETNTKRINRQPNKIAGLKIFLLAGSILTSSTIAFANDANHVEPFNFNIMSVGDMTENVITVQSSEGKRWDTISEANYLVEISGTTDAEALGVISTTTLYPGHCLTNECGTHPAIWSANPKQVVESYKLEIDVNSSEFFTAANGENLSPAAWLGEQMIAECNVHIGDDGSITDHIIPVSLPFSFVVDAENTGIMRQTATADFMLNCMAFDGNLVELPIQDDAFVASLDAGNNEGISGSGPSYEPLPEEDTGYIPEPEVDEEEEGGLDLGGLFPLPIPPEDPEFPEEPVDPVVNPDLGDMPDDFASPDGGVDPDPGPDPAPGILVLPIPPKPPVDPKVNPAIGKLPGDLTAGSNPTHSGKKSKAEKKAIRDALKKKKQARLKKAKQKQAILDAQRKKQNAKKKRKAEKKALRAALKKKAKKNKAAKRANPKPGKKKAVVKLLKTKKVKAKVKSKKRAGKKIVSVKKTKIKVAPKPLKKRTLKARKKKRS